MRGRRRTLGLGALVATAALATIGCDATPANIHPVKGHVSATGGDAAALNGHVIETRLQSDPLVRSSGAIDASGTFDLETLHEGQIVHGAPAGTHQARIVLNDDDPAAVANTKRALDPKYFDFEKSGLVIDVPATGEPTLQIQLR